MEATFDDRIYIYGLGEDYRVNAIQRVPKCASCMQMEFEADRMLQAPAVVWVYAVQNCKDIYDSYVESVKGRGFEGRVCFKILLEQIGKCLS